MREIKFRAWNKKIKSMGSALPLDVLIYDCTDINYDDLEIMQYTGLKDKNGKEIYHLDILALPMRFHGDHTLQPSTAVIQWEHDGWYVEDQGECGYSDMEVIGNIYENPELLKNGQ